MAATTNKTVTGDWSEIATEGDVLVTFISGRGCEVAVAASTPAAELEGHPLTKGKENGEFSAALEAGEKLYARARAGDCVLAVTN